MNKISTEELVLLKNRLRTANFKKLLKEKNTTKYQICKDTGVSYQTLCNWQAGRNIPSEPHAILVGKYLGIISPDQEELIKLKQQHQEMGERIERLEDRK